MRVQNQLLKNFKFKCGSQLQEDNDGRYFLICDQLEFVDLRLGQLAGLSI